MTDGTNEAPIWLIQCFHARGGSGYLLRYPRPGRVQLWTDGEFVAKVYPRDLTGEAVHEQYLAGAAGAFAPSVTPLGAEMHGSFAVGWWEKLSASLDVTPAESLTWLRRLHDGAYASLPEATLVPVPAQADTYPQGAVLAARLQPLQSEAHSIATELRELPKTLVHADANPTNIVRADGVVTGLDFAFSGLGPRVYDVATVAVIAVETRRARNLDDAMASALSTYGDHSDVGVPALETAARLVAINRAVACLKHRSWLGEGFRRVEALDEGKQFVFEMGEGPK